MEKKLYKSPNSKICGVCAGIADYFNIDPTIIRIIACILLVYTAFFPMLIAYLIMAAVMPRDDENYFRMYNNTSKPLTKGRDKKIAGVCSGFAEYFGFDATILRILFVLAIIVLGSGLMAYIICALIMPSSEDTYNQYNQNPNAYNAYQDQNQNFGGYQQQTQNYNGTQDQNFNGYQQYQYDQPNSQTQAPYNSKSQAGDAFENSDKGEQEQE